MNETVFIAAAAVAVVVCAGILFGLRPRKFPLFSSEPMYREHLILANHGPAQPTIVLPRGVQAKLRIIAPPGSDLEVAIPALGIARRAVGGKTTTIDLEPEEEGVVELTISNGTRATILVVA